jgi:hypothetical protein
MEILGVDGLRKILPMIKRSSVESRDFATALMA